VDVAFLPQVTAVDPLRELKRMMKNLCTKQWHGQGASVLCLGCDANASV